MKSVMKKATALILSAMMTAGIFSYSMPKDETAVNAASTNKVLAFGENMKTILKTGANTENAPIVYFGYQAQLAEPMDWNVVGFDGTGVGRDSNSGCATLLSRYVMGNAVYANMVSGQTNYPYKDSALKKYVDQLAEERTTYSEYSAIKATEDGAYWPLSLSEASLLSASLRNINNMPKMWWLRTQLAGQPFAYVMYKDELASADISVDLSVRPAFNLDLSKVAFISAVNGGKPGAGVPDTFNTIKETSENEWKLTVFSDSVKNFRASRVGSGAVMGGDQIKIQFENAFHGANDYVSVIIADKNGNPLRYGFIDRYHGSSAVSMTIPKDLPVGQYILKVFSENKQPDKGTDTCTNIVNIGIEVIAEKMDVVIDLSTGETSPENIYASALAALWNCGLIRGDYDENAAYYDLDNDGNFDVVYNYYGTMSLKKHKDCNLTGKVTFSGYLLEGTNFSSITVIFPVNKPGTVKGLKAVSAGKNQVKLTWNPVEGVEGYLIYAQKDGKYGYVGMTTSGTAFTDKKALDTDYNYYWVFGYTRDSGKNMVPGGCEKYVYAKGVCLAVTNLKASSVSGGVKLTWTASSGAEGYLVYGIHPGGSYEYIGMTTQGTTFTDKKASKTDWNYYWVFPYHKTNGQMIVGGTAKYVYGKAK